MEHSSQETTALDKEVRSIHTLLQDYIDRLEDVDAALKNGMEWKIVTRVLDLLFFVIYAVTIVLLFIFLLPKKY